MNKSIEALKVNDHFQIFGTDTTYVVTRPLTTSGGQTRVTYRILGSDAGEFTVVRPSLSTVKVF